MNRAFVLGNGRSRLGLNLNSLKSAGKVFGCNAIYRDFHPDVLIATDPGISKEIEKSGYPNTHEFFTRKPMHDRSKLITEHYGYSSGPIAATYAAMGGFPMIYLLGFDLTGINGKHNNVYSGTPNYKDENTKETYYGNWVTQIQTILREYDELQFVRVGDDQYLPNKWKRHNFKQQTINEFLSEVNTVSWQKPNE